MKRSTLLAVLLITATYVFGQRDMTKYVIPQMGSQSEYSLSNGNTYPCIARPWGMNHWTPQTASNGERWQYTYDSHHLVGLKQTHQPSPWVGDYGMYSLMPTVGEKRFLEKDRQSWFSHKTEIIQPHYYQVYLSDYDVLAELTPTQRGAMMRFTFPQSDQSRIVIDAFDNASYVKVIPEERKIIGYSTQSYGYDERKPANFKNHFVILLDQPFDDFDLWAEDDFIANESQITGKRCGVILTYKTGAKTQITARMASSFISLEQAECNLQHEIATKNFDDLVAEGKDVWNEQLNRFEVKDCAIDDLDNVRVFYTCLYRMLLYPREFHEYDATGAIYHYSPYNGQIESGRMYTDNGFWDTFRAVHPFFNLFYPELSSHIMEGLANTYKESGWLPEWASPGHLGDAMIGSNSTSLIASAYLSGVQQMDMETLWEAMTKNAHHAHPQYLSVGRSGIKYYDKLGYIPNDVGLKENAARTLEYCYADFCMLQLAKALKKDKREIAHYAKRAYNYRNLFDPERGWMVGRDSQGRFDPAYNPYRWGGDFTEGTGQQYTWSVFHDPIGLEVLMGGRERFIASLDTIFTTPPIFDESAYGTVIHEIREMQVMNFGQYAHGNQPIQHMTYLYDWAAQPWKTQYWVRRIMSQLYKPTPDGYCGDEDNGQTSAWYVFSALGFYPVCPASGEYALGSPLFKQVMITMPNGNKIRLKATGNNDENIYVQTFKIDGVNCTRNYITAADLKQAATVEFEMGSKPNFNRGILSSDLPYSYSLDKNN